jgi:hypothetical protein
VTLKQDLQGSYSCPETLLHRTEDGWCNAEHIYPEGFYSTVHYKSSVNLDETCLHHCYVLGKGGKFWPQPTFKFKASDLPYEPMIAATCDIAWNAVSSGQHRLESELESADEIKSVLLHIRWWSA